MQKTILQTVLMCLFAFFGGLVSQHFFKPADSYAAEIEALRNDVAGAVQIYYDAAGKRRILFDAKQPVQDFYAANSILRMRLGTYPGADGYGDGGLPMITLHDTRGQQRLLLRLAQGNNQAPILVLKDSKGKDRVILGTAFKDGDEEPFMAYFDQYNVKHLVFGKF